MPNFSELTHLPLKIIFAVHFILVSWAIQGTWCPKSVLMYNLLFFISIMWAIHSKDSDEPVQFALFINVIAIIMDIIVLVCCYRDYGIAEEFSAAFMSINLVLRGVSSIYLLRIGFQRNGSLAAVFPASGTYSRQGYEDISQSVPQTSDFPRI